MKFFSEKMVKDANHILIVDDNPEIYQDFQRILLLDHTPLKKNLQDTEKLLFGDQKPPITNHLEDPQYQLSYCQSGEKAPIVLKNHLSKPSNIALAFVDMRMPGGWDGVETVHALWKVDPRLQVVICSAYSDLDWQKIRKEFHSNRDQLIILKKPFDPEEVLQITASMITKWNYNTNGKTLYQIHPKNMTMVEIKPRRVIDRKITHVQLLIEKNPWYETPDTPSKALVHFIENQKIKVEDLEKQFQTEYHRLIQAQQFLEESQN